MAEQLVAGSKDGYIEPLLELFVLCLSCCEQFLIIDLDRPIDPDTLAVKPRSK
jgi:hypothetical protein